MSTSEYRQTRSSDLFSCFPPYQYAPLEKQNNFRLLRLLPAGGEINNAHESHLALALQGTLLEYSLDDDSPYECLSYTWGPLEFTHSLILDGKVLEITENLSLALKSVKKAAKTKLLWVDAVCINQKDPGERAQQVGYMSTIYSRALQVLAYLGEQKDNSEDLPFTFTRIIVGVEKWKSAIPVNSSDLTRNIIQPAQFESLGLPPEGDSAWDCISSFLSRPWFARVWIIQEAALARELTLLCGDWTAFGETLFYFITLAMIHALPVGQGGSTSAGIGIRQLKMMFDIIKCSRTPSGDRHRGSQLSILELIQTSDHENATDPRDNIFALVGLSKERTVSDLKANYTESVADVYLRFAQYIIHAGLGPKLLEKTYNPGSILGLPSWTPDWRNRHLPFNDLASGNDLGLGRTGAYAGAGGNFANMSIEACGRRLLSKGYLVDQIVSIGVTRIGLVGQYEGQNPRHQLAAEFQASFEDLVDCIEELSQILDKRPLYPTSEPKDEVLWRTLLCNRQIGTPGEAPANYRAMLGALLGVVKIASVHDPGKRAWFSRLSACLPHFQDLTANVDDRGFESLLQSSIQFATAMFSKCSGRRRFLTKKGYVGQAPGISQRGDVICIINGATVPFTVRQKEDGYILLGQAYVHGFMKGEILSMPGYRNQDILLV